ncbi:hypothetical protein MN202_07320 [Rheinheimera muenzenbergensis]|uniref:AAA ATPase domain-containing protein n=1 Tax=Rheinheimera muenzenbergensis TaxID=1193628 RepID=A0ABU8C549_9GAMM
MDSASFEALFKRLDFDRPLDYANPQDQRLYVDNLHSANGIEPIEELQINIEMSENPTSWLFTGHRGVGKSTELRRMAVALRDNKHMVIVADMGEYLNLAEPITTEMLLLTMVAALADGADALLKPEKDKPSYVRRLWDCLNNTEVNISEIDFEAAGFTLKAVLKQNDNLKQKVMQAIAGAPAKLAQQVREFAKQISEDARKTSREDTKVILILDSLERLRVTGGDARVCYDAITRTFETNGDYLKLQHIHVVYSVPPYLPFLCPRIGSYYGVEVCTLPHVKVFETPEINKREITDVKPFDEGLNLLVQCVRNRYPDVEQLIPNAMLKELALASSGSVRDYFRLIKSVCTKARVAKAPVPLESSSPLSQLATQVLMNEMPLAEEDKQWLLNVRKTHGTGLDSISNLHELARLFDSGIILNYRNGRDWCDVHYLLHSELALYGEIGE